MDAYINYYLIIKTITHENKQLQKRIDHISKLKNKKAIVKHTASIVAKSIIISNLAKQLTDLHKEILNKI